MNAYETCAIEFDPQSCLYFCFRAIGVNDERFVRESEIIGLREGSEIEGELESLFDGEIAVRIHEFKLLSQRFIMVDENRFME